MAVSILAGFWGQYFERKIHNNQCLNTCPTLQEETRKMSSKVTLEAIFPSSNLLNSTAKEINSPTLEAPQPEFFSSKQEVTLTPNAYGGQFELSPCSSSRTLVSILGMNKNGEQEIHLDQSKIGGTLSYYEITRVNEGALWSMLASQWTLILCDFCLQHGTELTRDDRRKLYSSFGLLYPYGHEELAIYEDIDQVFESIKLNICYGRNVS